MTLPSKRRNALIATSRPAPHEREQAVLNAVAALPAESRTPSAAVAALLRQGFDIPYSTLAQMLRRLERQGAIHLGRKKP